MKEKRVVITGLGAVTPIGVGVDNFLKGLNSGQNGIARVTRFDAADFSSQLAAEVKNFDPQEWIEPKLSKRMDRFSQFAVASSGMAIEDAGLNHFAFNSERAGVIIGSGIGGSQTIEDGYRLLSDRGPKSLSPFLISKLLINMAACMTSIIHGLKGPISAPSVACSSGANAIGDAFRIIQRSDADIMLAGGSEAAITPLAYGGFCATRSMSRRNDSPEIASRPFDKNRDGFVMGEGSGIVVLENLEHARQRKAKIYAELIGYGNAADAFHFTAPEASGEGMCRVMKQAIGDAGIKITDTNYINAHGTSTILNDKIESFAIMKLFGEHVKNIKTSSIKSMMGHLLAAAGAVECISTVLSIYTGMLPPTINYETPDPDCPLSLVTGGAQLFNPEVAISNSFGFGGGNACLVFRKFGGEP
jgi:3-oxoacyl-[acyl-carrier-protein] synthase II